MIRGVARHVLRKIGRRSTICDNARSLSDSPGFGSPVDWMGELLRTQERCCGATTTSYSAIDTDSPVLSQRRLHFTRVPIAASGTMESGFGGSTDGVGAGVYGQVSAPYIPSLHAKAHNLVIPRHPCTLYIYSHFTLSISVKKLKTIS